MAFGAMVWDAVVVQGAVLWYSAMGYVVEWYVVVRWDGMVFRGARCGAMVVQWVCGCDGTTMSWSWLFCGCDGTMSCVVAVLWVRWYYVVVDAKQVRPWF